MSFKVRFNFSIILGLIFAVVLLTTIETMTAQAGSEGSSVDSNVTYGDLAGTNLSSTYTMYNTFIGSSSGYSTFGDASDSTEKNTFVGAWAGYSNSKGDNNTFIGGSAGRSNTTGRMNTFIGRDAGESCQSGTESNVLIGDSCGQDMFGNNNTFVGEDSGRRHSYDSVGNASSDGSGNVFIGANSGYHNTGQGNVFIGFNVGSHSDSKNENNILMIDNSDTTSPLIFGDFAADEVDINGVLSVTGYVVASGHVSCNSGITCTGNLSCSSDITCKTCYLNSDKRWKTAIEPLNDSLAAIKKLNGVSYLWNKAEFPERDFADDPQIGLIAQDVEKVLPEIVKTDAEGYKSIAYTQIVPVLIEAVKTQQTIIEKQQKELKAQRQSLQSQIDELRFLLTDLVGERM